MSRAGDRVAYFEQQFGEVGLAAEVDPHEDAAAFEHGAGRLPEVTRSLAPDVPSYRLLETAQHRLGC